MDADFKSLEAKIGQLITLCGDLRAQNTQLRGDLSQAQQKTNDLKSNMLLASTKLEVLLESMPVNAQTEGVDAK